jgi:hypothetical protein
VGHNQTQKTAGISFSGAGPVESSWQLRYYNSLDAKEMGLYFFRTYVTKGEFTFILDDSLEEDSEEIALAKHAMRAKSLRERKVDEVPSDPGFCIDRGFLASESYDQQETFSAGLYLPSFPDVTFSVHSNKDAYADYSPTDFANVKLSLLDRIEEAKQEQGKNYPQRTLLREGKRKVQHWHGEESLIRRSDGAHDFEWHFVGRPKDVANPSEFSAGMFTKVKDNIVGNAPKSSLSNDEAVALFDKLLSSLKFRVVVANAPQGSYYFPSDTKLKK